MDTEKELIPEPSCRARRTFLNRLWALIGMIACIELGWVGSSILRSRKERKKEKRAETVVGAGRVDQFKPNSVKAITQGQFYLACLEDGSFLALSRRCTHLGCSVPWDGEKQLFVCPCHGSTFTIRGEVLSAPATRPLEFYPLRIEDGAIKVDISQSLRRGSFQPSQAVRV